MDEILAQLFPQAPSYFPGLLGQEQANLLQQQAQRQGLLGIGMGLLQAAAPSTTRPSLGAGIAQGLATGQQMAQNVYMQRLQEQQIAQQLAEQQRVLQEQQAARAILPQIMRQGQAQPTFYGQPTASPLRDDEGNVMPGAGVSQGAPSLDMNSALRLLTEAPSVAAKVLPTVQAFQKLSQPERVTLKQGEQVFEVRDGRYVPVAGEAKPELREVGGALYEFSPGQAPKLVIDSKGKLTGDFANYAKGMYGTDVVTDLPAGAFERIQNAIIEQKKAGATVVDMTGGQKGFENETKLRTEFQGSPEYKAFGEMKAAYGQVLEGLKKSNAIGDLAAATKIMKLLDPGSVVRESELALAMQAGGLLDRVSNYATNIMQGTKLSPDQRREFSSLANSLFSVSLDAFNEKRNQYQGLAREYGFDINRVIGAEPKIPGLQAAQVPTLSIQDAAAAELRRRRGQ
jgi:hypothetical protein